LENRPFRIDTRLSTEWNGSLKWDSNLHLLGEHSSTAIPFILHCHTAVNNAAFALTCNGKK